MKKSKIAFKEGFEFGWRLFWSPFVGAYQAMEAAANRPPAANWKEFIVNDIRLYFAPLTGAIAGFRKALHGLPKKDR
jgi:hypothetical protein